MRFAATREKVEVKNVFSGEKVGEYVSPSKEDVLGMLEQMQSEQRKWMECTKNDREEQIRQYH